MNIKQLEIFAAVAQHASFTRAAIALDFSQSHITTQVRRLEEQVGAPLFDRKGRGIRLTDRGRILLGYARRLEALVREAQAAVSSPVTCGTLSVAAHESLAIYCLPELVATLRKTLPEVDIKLTMVEETKIGRAILEDNVDVALLYSTNGSHVREGNAIALNEEAPVIVCSPSLPLAQTRRISAPDFNSFDALVTTHACPTRESFDQMLEAACDTTPRLHEFTSVETMKQFALRGLGYAVLPRLAVAEQIRNGDLVELEAPTKLQPITTTLIFSPQKSNELSAFVDATRTLYATKSS